jgi:hypothetical protein
MKTILLCFLFVLGLIGCTQPPSNSGPGITGNPSGQVIPIQSSPFPNIIPTPIENRGSVIGRLVSATPGQSLSGIALYFGTIIPLTPGPRHVISMDIVNSPKSYILDQGRFIAKNIPPGDYVLIIWMPKESLYVPDPANPGNEFIVKVISNQIVDIGTLQAPNLR